MDMYQTLQTTIIVFSLLIAWIECRPAERAETPGTSPFDLIADVKEGIAYNLIQRRIIDSVHPKPIVDTLTENEKYGNNGEHQIGRAVVKGVEGVSNLVNSALETPKEASRQAASKLTQFFDNLGGKLVGLQ